MRGGREGLVIDCNHRAPRGERRDFRRLWDRVEGHEYGSETQGASGLSATVLDRHPLPAPERCRRLWGCSPETDAHTHSDCDADAYAYPHPDTVAYRDANP